MIPKVIHQIWIGPAPAPQALMDTWKTMPGWTYELWDDARIAAFGLRNRRQYDASPEWCGKADVARYEILERHGGVYVDADSLRLRDLPDELLAPEAFAAYEHEELKPGMVANGVLGSKPGGRLMRLAAHAASKADVRSASAWRATGPEMLSRVVASCPDAVVVHPSRMFYPVHHTGRLAPGDAEPYAHQHWGSTRGYQPSWSGAAASPGAVDVVVPVFNAAKYVAEAADSILAQGSVLRRVVFVDDGSTDGSADVVRGLARRDARVELVEMESNAGPSAARNAGLARAAARYVLFFDADDLMVNGALAVLSSALEDAGSGDGSAFGRMVDVIDGAGSVVPTLPYSYEPHRLRSRITAQDLVSGLRPYGYTTVMYRRDDLVRLGGFDTSLRQAEDWELAYRVAKNVGPMRFVDVGVLRYRVHGTNTCAKIEGGQFVTPPDLRGWYIRAMAKHGIAAR